MRHLVAQSVLEPGVIPGLVLLVGLAVQLLGCNNVDLETIPEEPGYLNADLGNVAVVTGDFDRVEELLASFDIPFTLYDGFVAGPPEDAELMTQYAQPMPPVEQLLGDIDELRRYDTLFLNCGIRGTGVIDPGTLEQDTTLLDDPDYAANLREFVENGGALLVTDRSYVLLEAAFPDAIDFQGSDAVPGSALVGAPGTVTAVVEDEALREALGVSAVDVTFENEAWAMVLGASGVWLSADVFRMVGTSDLTIVPDTPILVHQVVGLGRITLTSFHNLPRVDQTWTTLQIKMLEAMAGG